MLQALFLLFSKSKSSRSHNRGLTHQDYRGFQDASLGTYKTCYVCCYLSSKVITIIRNNPKTMYFINVNSYNLNGRAGEDNDDLIYDIENEKGGILETLLGMGNVFLINPAQVPLGEEEIPYKTCIHWIQKIYTTLTSNLEQQRESLQPAQQALLEKLKGNMFSIDFALRKLKEVGQNQLGTIPDDIQTEFNKYKQNENGGNPVDTEAWGLFVKGQLDNVKAILGETTYKDKKRNIEKMFGAILPGIAALNNDAMGMSYLLAKGLAIAVQEQNGNKSLLLEQLKTLREQLKIGRNNARSKFKVSMSMTKIESEDLKRITEVRAGVGHLRCEFLKGDKKTKEQIEDTFDMLLHTFRHDNKSCQVDLNVFSFFQTALDNSELSTIVTINKEIKKDAIIISDVLNKFRIMSESDKPSPEEYFKLLLSTFTNFKDRMVEKAKTTMPYMDPIHLMKESAKLVGETQVSDTFDEIITDLESDDTTAILYGLAFNKDMSVQAQLSKTFAQEGITSLLSSFGVAPDKQILFEDTVTKESSDKYFSNNPKAISDKMPNSDKVLKNINSLTRIIQGP